MLTTIKPQRDKVMKNEALQQYLQDNWNNTGHFQQPDAQVWQAAINNGHIERAKACIALKDFLKDRIIATVNAFCRLDKNKSDNTNCSNSSKSIAVS